MTARSALTQPHPLRVVMLDLLVHRGGLCVPRDLSLSLMRAVGLFSWPARSLLHAGFGAESRGWLISESGSSMFCLEDVRAEAEDLDKGPCCLHHLIAHSPADS